MYIFNICTSILLRITNLAGKICRQNPNAHFMSTNISKNRTVYEIQCKNIVRAGHATYDNMGHVQCMLDTSGYKHALRMCNNYCFSTAIMVARTRLYVTLNHMTCFVYINNWPSGHNNCSCSQRKTTLRDSEWGWTTIIVCSSLINNYMFNISINLSNFLSSTIFPYINWLFANSNYLKQ
jgi:hypothetical protein